MKDKTTGCTHKEANLAESYVRHNCNTLKAYENSLYSQNCSIATKRVSSYKILHKPHVWAYVQRLLNKNKVKSSINADKIREGLRELAFPSDNVKVSNRDRLRAMELLGKSFAMFTDNVNMNDVQRQRVLDELEKAEADAIAAIRLKQIVGGSKALPGPMPAIPVESIIKDVQNTEQSKPTDEDQQPAKVL